MQATQAPKSTFVVRPARANRGGGQTAKKTFLLSTLSPIIVYILAVLVFPLIWVLMLMFFDYSPGRVGGAFLGFGGNNPFVGLDNFREMFAGTSLMARMFRQSLVNTLVFAFLVLPINLIVTLPLAALIESVHERLKGFFRAIYFLPAITTSVAVAMLWRYIYDPRFGLLDSIIRMFGGKPIAWLTDPNLSVLGITIAMWAVIIAYIWHDFGYNLVIFIAALQGIPKEIREAAMIDGANAFQIFTRITIPLLKPTLLFVCVMTMISSFQVFDIIQVMTNGDPNNMTRVLELDIYENAFRFQNMGWAAAISFVLLFVVGTITFLQMRLLRTDWEY